MSQYPQPYPPPQSPYGGYPPPQAPPSSDDLLAPARRAGMMMIVVAVLFVLFGLCMGVVAYLVRHPAFTSMPEFTQVQEQFRQLEAESGMSVETMLLINGLVPLVLGAVFGGLGFYVRGGGFVAVVLGIVATAGLLLLTGLVLVGTLIGGLARRDPSQLLGLCIVLVPFGLLVLLMAWLVQAARAGSRVAAARQQYQSQLWQYQQYQQAYLRPPQHNPPPPGMGYHFPAPPAPPAAPAPPPPPAPPPGALNDTKDPGDGDSPGR